MWELESERYYVELVPGKDNSVNFWATRHIAVKDDGTRISLRGGARDEEFFIYKDTDVSFEFKARRHDEDRKLLSVYRIYLGPFLPKGITLERAREIARNIREALLILPPLKVSHNGEPPTDVIFDMSFWDKRHPDEPAGGNFP